MSYIVNREKSSSKVDRKIQINRIYTAVIVGAILAVLISFSPGSFFILMVTIGTALFICRFSNKSERNFILIIFLTGLGLRVIFTSLMLSYSIFGGHMLSYTSMGFPDYSTPYIFGDSGYYTLRALFTSMYWLGEPIYQHIVEYSVKASYGFSGFLYVLAAFFTIFGYSPISSRFINCFLGALTTILVYSIVKNIFNEKPARLAAILTAFFPSMFLWSTTNLKEPSMIFAVCLMLWSLVKFQRSKSVYYLIITVLSIWLQFCIRYSYRMEFFFVTFAIVLCYVLYLCISSLSLRKRVGIFLLIVIIGAYSAFIRKDKVKLAIGNLAQKIYICHIGVINTGGICYKLLPDEFYTGLKNMGLNDFSKMLGKGWFHIMLEPLPRRMQSKAMLFSFPQMLLWYFLIPFAALGVALSVRYRLRESIILIAYFLVMTSVLAVTGGNIGTIFRLRDINTPIILIFSSIGLFNTFSSLKLKLDCKC